MPLFLLFVAVPIIEIALFIQLGSFLGLWTTLLIVVLTAIIGTWLVRQQGLAVLTQVQRSLQEMRDPTEPLAHGAMVLFSGALLLTPGFFTDAIGFALLVPQVRMATFRYIRARLKTAKFTMHAASGQSRRPSQGYSGGAPKGPNATVIEGEIIDLDAPSNTQGPPSGWTRH
ncbi:MAG: UPF0716 protein FxsA [Paracoccaceae bacterium]|jgi:UPF0716 protein FxsA